MERQKRYASSKLGGKEQQRELGQFDETEPEKKLVKHTWDMAKVYRAHDITGKDWAVLGALTTLSPGVRLWHIDAPDQLCKCAPSQILLQVSTLTRKKLTELSFQNDCWIVALRDTWATTSTAT